MKNLFAMSLAIPHALSLVFLGLLGVITLFSLGLLWFMVTRPARWSQFVDRENDFWVGKGLVSAQSAERFRRFEKGPGQKILVALSSLLSAAAIIFLIIALWRQAHG
jgi:hypothetical protein